MNIIEFSIDTEIECMCGNTSCDSGFSPCDEQGNEIEPLEGLWKNLYVCDKCKQIFKQVD